MGQKSSTNQLADTNPPNGKQIIMEGIIYGNGDELIEGIITPYKENIPNKPSYPPGEYYYIRGQDIISPLLIEAEERKKIGLSEKIRLYFELKKVVNSNNQHSFRISIINNSKINNETYLGNLESRTGNNIKFGNYFEIEYLFERQQIINIIPIINGETFGEKIEMVLSNLIMRQDNEVSIEIKDVGTLIINYSKINEQDELNKEISIFQFSITLNNDIFKTEKYLENMFYVIKNKRIENTKRPIYKSHEYNLKLNTKRELTLISFDSDILYDNEDEDIYFELYSPSFNNKNFIGETSFTIKQLKNKLEKDDKNEIVPIKSNKYQYLGFLEINYNSRKKMSFEKFAKIGKINLEIAIDYTLSNKDVNDPESLHYIDDKIKNDYEIAIRACGNILSNYNKDKIFQVYGFGGIPQNSKEANHCFSINFNEDNPDIKGIDNVINLYKESLKKIELSSPTYLSPILKNLIKKIEDDLKKNPEENNYYFLLVLTDGILNDYWETVNNIVKASKLPLSIVIIGIGNYDFGMMHNFDGDEKPLISTVGEIRKRDIVQFVEFNKFKGSIDRGTDLAEEVLKEIPRQVEDYYKYCV